MRELYKTLGLGIFALFLIVTVCGAIFGCGILATNLFNVLF